MAGTKKEFNTKLYAVIVFFLIAAILAGITVITYRSKYNGFNPEKVAIAFTESIVERGDGYNAYKNTIVSKNYKYGDYIREYYMFPIIYAESGYKPGDDTDDMKGLNDDSYISDKTKNDNGSLAGEVIDKMYPYYEALMETYGGWDDYDTIFTLYFEELVRVRYEVFGDKYMTDEIMFTALEANVSSYGDTLTGTEEEYDENTNLKISDKTIGIYEKAFGGNYDFDYEVVATKDVDNLDEYKSSLDKETLETYKISADDISAAKICTVAISANDKEIARYDVVVVQIKSTWYVDNTNTDTTALYEIGR